MESATGRYPMTLVEELRIPYWNENLSPRLERITTRMGIDGESVFV